MTVLTAMEGDDVVSGCTCNAGHFGAVGSSVVSPFYSGGCTPMRCPLGSSGTDLPTGDCTCNAGWSGSVGSASAAVPFFSGSGCHVTAGMVVAFGHNTKANSGGLGDGGVDKSTNWYDGSTWSETHPLEARPVLLDTLGRRTLGLSVGQKVVLYLRSDGRIWASGWNQDGQVDPPSFLSRSPACCFPTLSCIRVCDYPLACVLSPNVCLPPVLPLAWRRVPRSHETAPTGGDRAWFGQYQNLGGLLPLNHHEDRRFRLGVRGQ